MSDSDKLFDEYIEAERRVGEAVAYAKAKKEAWLAAKPGNGANAPRKKQEAESRPAELDLGLHSDADATLPRGAPEMYAKATYVEAAPRALTGIEAHGAILKKHGIDIPSSSLYRAIKRLAEQGVIERVGTSAAFRAVVADERPNLRQVK